jgi:hypothetical protein
MEEEKIILQDDVYHAFYHILSRNDMDLPDYIYRHEELTDQNIFNNLIRAVLYKHGYGKYLNCPPINPEDIEVVKIDECTTRHVYHSKCGQMYQEDKRAISQRRYWG